MENEANGQKAEEQMWRRVSNPGRRRNYETAYDLWTAACEYFKWSDENPLSKVEIYVVNKEIQREIVPLKRPYTLMALCTYIGVGQAYFRQYHSEQKKMPEGFAEVIETIEDIIYTQKFEGAAVGMFKENIIVRELGLADKKEVKAQVNLKDAPIEFE